MAFKWTVISVWKYFPLMPRIRKSVELVPIKLNFLTHSYFNFLNDCKNANSNLFQITMRLCIVTNDNFSKKIL